MANADAGFVSIMRHDKPSSSSSAGRSDPRLDPNSDELISQISDGLNKGTIAVGNTPVDPPHIEVPNSNDSAADKNNTKLIDKLNETVDNTKTAIQATVQNVKELIQTDTTDVEKELDDTPLMERTARRESVKNYRPNDTIGQKIANTWEDTKNIASDVVKDLVDLATMDTSEADAILDKTPIITTPGDVSNNPELVNKGSAANRVS